MLREDLGQEVLGAFFPSGRHGQRPEGHMQLGTCYLLHLMPICISTFLVSMLKPS